MTLSAGFSIFALASIGLICFAGALYKGFHENMMQLVGMGFLTIACAAIIEDIIDRCASGPHEVSAQRVALFAGLLLYSLGTAWKVYKVNRARARLSVFKNGYGHSKVAAE